jgi:Peptidase family M48
MRHTHLRLQRPGTANSVCLFRVATFRNLCLCWLVLFPRFGDGQTRSVTRPNDLLATDPRTFAQWLHTARPTPVSAEVKARIVASLPPEGEVDDLKVADLTKLAGLGRVFHAMDRDSVYVVKVVDVPQAGVGLHERAVVLISETALGLLTTDELQAVAAHEIGHEYVWDEYARAVALGDRNRTKELELMCDAIAIVTLDGLGVDSSRLISALEKISRFNHDRLGTALNEQNYPTVAERRAFARSVCTWLTAMRLSRLVGLSPPTVLDLVAFAAALQPAENNVSPQHRELSVRSEVGELTTGIPQF